MAKTDNLTDFLTGIANAIRTKKGTTAKINPQNFETEIENISKPEQEKTATPTNTQQTVLPDNGKTLSKVIIKPAPLPGTTNNVYKNINGCLIETVGKTLLLGCGDSIIPNDGTVTSIGLWAFNDCEDLINISIPDSIISIGRAAFAGSGLTNIEIPNSVNSIKSQAFQGCKSLTNVSLGSGVNIIENMAFSYCDTLASLSVAKGNNTYHSNGNCVIETETKKLIIGCENSLIPNDGSVTSIGYEAFSGRHGLTSITIPDSVTIIDTSAFHNCIGLTSVVIGNGVTNIAPRAFADCSELTSITIPNSVTNIGSGAFSGCYNIIRESKNVYYVDKWVIDVENKSLSTAEIESTAIGIAENAFGDYSELTSVTIPDSVMFICSYAFYNCSGLTSVTIPDSVKSIESGVFSGCSGLTSVTILSTTPPRLGRIVFPSNVTTITVPVGCGDAYKTAEDWSDYADKIVEATA